MYPYWVECPELSAEAAEILNDNDVVVYEDMPHQCYHVVLYNDEWTSVLMPWGEEVREILRRRSWICHNDQSNAEYAKQQKEFNESMEKGDSEEYQLLSDIAHSVATYARGRDYYVMPGGDK
jgi:hypothetical protein